MVWLLLLMLTCTSNLADLNGHPETMACFTSIKKQLKISGYLSSFISAESFMLPFNFKCAQSVISLHYRYFCMEVIMNFLCFFEPAL
jgi:hypothetical protein